MNSTKACACHQQGRYVPCPFNRPPRFRSRTSCSILTFIFIFYCLVCNKLSCADDERCHQLHHQHQNHLATSYELPENLLHHHRPISTQSLSSHLYVTQPLPENTPTLRGFVKQSTGASFEDIRIKRWISPSRLSDLIQEPDGTLFSPIFEHSSPEAEHNPQERDASSAHNLKFQFENHANLVDMIEPGSGDAPIGEETIDPSRVLSNQFSSPSIFPGPSENQPPIPSKRLPVLVATAGLPWRYTIPSDTFEDEIGSMRNLRSFLEYTPPSAPTLSDQEQPFDKYTHWLQYDDRAQTLIGFPTTPDVGKHSYELVVTDDFGQDSNMTLEIVVRQHPSIRAFSHSFSLVDIEWNSSKFNSITKFLLDLDKRISEGLYSDQSSTNLIIHSYQLPANNSNSITKPLSPITITWSNASIPVYPCNSTQLDTLLKNLVEEQHYSSNPTISTEGTTSYAPSLILRKALEPELTVSRVDFTLRGSCRNAILPTTPDYERPVPDLIQRTRMQRLKWRLGQPFIYSIPDIIVEADNKSEKNMTFTLHTIDGLPLEDDPRYSYMEFDQETRTLYGLPYDLNLHAGQRELLLTARYTNLEHKVARDVLIVDITNPDLTTINNRAFNMSLYFISRVNKFGPQVRIGLAKKIVQSLDVRELDYSPEQIVIEFATVEVKKFHIDAPLSALIDHSNSWVYHDKIRRVEDDPNWSDQREAQGPLESSILYKFTWTNESIGHRGDCPIEVIIENVVSALERNMFDYDPEIDDSRFQDDPNKNDSVRFYERLRSYFEPEIDLVFLSIGPMEGSACVNSLSYYDVGNSELADLVNLADLAPEHSTTPEIILPGPTNVPKAHDEFKLSRPMINSDEYWSIVVLIILVVALIFVIMMFFMGMHTYRINQEKRFELQVKLAQARQNSMYLSSMMLAEPMQRPDLANRPNELQQQWNGLMDENGTPRKPLILDNEKRAWTNGNAGVDGGNLFKSTAVQLRGQTVQTTPLRPNMTFTLDSIASFQSPLHLATNPLAPGVIMPNHQLLIDDRKRSMTLNRRVPNGESQQVRMMARQGSMNQLDHSQSILTMASLAGPVQLVPNHQNIANVPIVYAPLPVVCESGELVDPQTNKVTSNIV